MRLFVALEILAAIRQQVAEWRRERIPELPKARWVREENLHLTLIFLGELAPECLEALSRALRAACAGALPVSLGVRGGGTFPPRREARVAWLGIEGIVATARTDLGELVSLLAQAAADAVGFVPEKRPYHPHLTLARPVEPWPVEVAERFQIAAQQNFGEPFKVDSAVLMASELGSGGTRYRVVERFGLGGER